ncbi:hypothetical protein GCM10027269_16390 [Kribbella endophytica]
MVRDGVSAEPDPHAALLCGDLQRLGHGGVSFEWGEVPSGTLGRLEGTGTVGSELVADSEEAGDRSHVLTGGKERTPQKEVSRE